jgi:hypothetical protein
MGTASWAAQSGWTEARSVKVCISGHPKVLPAHGVETAVSKIFISIDMESEISSSDQMPFGISSAASENR